MGFFSSTSPFDEDVEKATSETNTNDDWDKIIDICDKVGTSTQKAKDCLKSITKRMNNPDPHVVLQAITLLEACVKNCGTPFCLEVASREFENELVKMLKQKFVMQPKINEKLRSLLKSWAENEFKNDPQLSLIPSLYYRLKQEGLDFNIQPDPSTRSRQGATGSNSVAAVARQEEDDLRKAIELSLKESKSDPRGDSLSSLYPSAKQLAKATPPPTTRKVRTLYDFEAVEDNELTFHAGEIIHVIDDSDVNWWKGQNQRGEGLFPANFVTSNLDVEPEIVEPSTKSNKKIVFDENVTVYKEEASASSPEPVEIDENKIDRLIHLLHEADPEDASHDTYEMLNLESQVNAMGPLIDTELETVDKEHAQLTQLSAQLVEALNLYHTLMREPFQTAGGPPPGPVAQKSPFPGPYPSAHQQQQPPLHGQHQHMQPSSLPPMNMYNGLGHQQYPPSSGQYQSLPGAPPPQYMGQNVHYQHGQPPAPNSNMPVYGGMPPPQYQHPPTHQQQGVPPPSQSMPPQHQMMPPTQAPPPNNNNGLVTRHPSLPPAASHHHLPPNVSSNPASQPHQLPPPPSHSMVPNMMTSQANSAQQYLAGPPHPPMHHQPMLPRQPNPQQLPQL